MSGFDRLIVNEMFLIEIRLIVHEMLYTIIRLLVATDKDQTFDKG